MEKAKREWELQLKPQHTTATRAHPRGTIHDPLDADDRKAKYIDCVLGKLDDAAAEDLQGLLAAFETIEDLESIMKFLRFDAG